MEIGKVSDNNLDYWELIWVLVALYCIAAFLESIPEIEISN
jgi:hypothetical protein